MTGNLNKTRCRGCKKSSHPQYLIEGFCKRCYFRRKRGKTR